MTLYINGLEVLEVLREQQGPLTFHEIWKQLAEKTKKPINVILRSVQKAVGEAIRYGFIMKYDGYYYHVDEIGKMFSPRSDDYDNQSSSDDDDDGDQESNESDGARAIEPSPITYSTSKLPQAIKSSNCDLIDHRSQRITKLATSEKGKRSRRIGGFAYLRKQLRKPVIKRSALNLMLAEDEKNKYEAVSKAVPEKKRTNARIKSKVAQVKDVKRKETTNNKKENFSTARKEKMPVLLAAIANANIRSLNTTRDANYNYVAANIKRFSNSYRDKIVAKTEISKRVNLGGNYLENKTGLQSKFKEKNKLDSTMKNDSKNVDSKLLVKRTKKQPFKDVKSKIYEKKPRRVEIITH